jgi:type IV pilus assembly protein PilW
MNRSLNPASLPVRILQRGLSLVELMVGLTVGLVIALGLFTMISSASQTFRVQDDFARTQESATFALRYVGDSLRHAGFYGSLFDPTNVQNMGTSMTGGTYDDCGTALNPPTGNWALWTRESLVPFVDLTSGNVTNSLACVRGTNFQDGPALVIRGAVGYRIPDPNALALADTIMVQSDPYGAIQFYGSAFAGLKASAQTKFLPTGGDYDVFQYMVHVYYIRPCSRPTGGGGTICLATDDGGLPIPTLVRQELVNSTMTEVPLAEGIERIDFRYGLDSDGDGVADQFVRMPQPIDITNGNVVSVRVSVLARSPTIIRDYDDTGKQYDLNGDGAPDFRCNPTDAVPPPTICSYKRKVFTQLFQLRNIAQRKGA